MVAPCGKPVIVERPRNLGSEVFGVAEIEDDAHPGAAEILGHLRFAAVGRARAPGALLLGQLRLALQRIAAPRRPMGVHVDDCHPSLATKPLSALQGKREGPSAQRWEGKAGIGEPSGSRPLTQPSPRWRLCG